MAVPVVFSMLLADAALMVLARIVPNMRIDDLALSLRNILFFIFMPLYALGLMGATRRMQHYADTSWQPLMWVAFAGALVIFAGWSPYRVVIGAYLFGAAITLGNELQIHGVKVNPFLVDSIPYLLTLIVLTAIARKQGHVVPQSLGQNLQ